ncbi:Ig-like domain-containing protein [Prescottella defluvii]|nr:Ig-like domain-containing protein [Prescottella defluvii]
MFSTPRRWMRPVTAATIASSLVLGSNLAFAASVEVSFNEACRASSVIDVDNLRTDMVTVEAPATVEPGQQFTYRIQTGPQSYPATSSRATTISVSRLKNDFEIPANAIFVGATVVAGTGINLDNVAPNVLRIDDNGVVNDASGGVLRLSGNNEVIGNSPSSNTDSEGGILVPKNSKNLDGSTNPNGDTWFQMPAVEVTMTAGQSGVITPKLRTAGAAGDFDNDANFNTSLAKASLFGTHWAATRCSPRDTPNGPLNGGAGPLATITISSPTNVKTSTVVSAPESVRTGAPVTLLCHCVSDTRRRHGAVPDRRRRSGRPVSVVDGQASVSHTFADAGEHKIGAVYSGAPGTTTSTSEVRTMTVAGSDEPSTNRAPETAVLIALGATAVAALLVVVWSRSRRK